MTVPDKTGLDNSARPDLVNPPPTEIVTIRPDTETLTRQRLPYFVGISGATAGAQGISMNLVVIPPGQTAEPHYHRDFETAIYLIQGRVETRYGEGLQQSVVNEAGDFIFIPPNVPHQPTNLNPDEPAYALVARNDPNEQENVVLYEDSAETPSTP
jgi:uncharacterized RmlC-like cupin family protein